MGTHDQGGATGAMMQEHEEKLKKAVANLKQRYQEHHAMKMSRQTKVIHHAKPINVTSKSKALAPTAKKSTKRVGKAVANVKKTGNTRGAAIAIDKGRLMEKSRKDFAMHPAGMKLAF